MGRRLFWIDSHGSFRRVDDHVGIKCDCILWLYSGHQTVDAQSLNGCENDLTRTLGHRSLLDDSSLRKRVSGYGVCKDKASPVVLVTMTYLACGRLSPFGLVGEGGHVKHKQTLMLRY